MDSEKGMIDFMDRLTAVDLLHLDDLGAENSSDWVLEQLYSIVNARYEAEQAIVATTNLMPDELSERLGARTVSRLVRSAATCSPCSARTSGGSSARRKPGRPSPSSPPAERRVGGGRPSGAATPP